MSNQKKLRIAVCDLVTSFGGVQRVMVNLLPELAKQFDICVVDPYANANYAEKLCKVNVQTYFTPFPHKQPGQVVFLLPAMIQYIKGQHLAVNALAHLVEKGHNVALWFAGDVATGGNRKYLEGLHRKVDKLGTAHLVHFLGWCDDIYQLMTAADVVMLCSMEYESFGMALAEAMTLRKPCIGANVGGIGEVIADKHSGLLFTPGSDDSLAGAMALLATNTEMRDNFGRVGRRRVEKLFTVAVQANKISTIINIMTT